MLQTKICDLFIQNPNQSFQSFVTVIRKVVSMCVELFAALFRDRYFLMMPSRLVVLFEGENNMTV